jgi:hypothetical protein
VSAEKKPHSGISVIQVVASALAAATATLALSYLGVAGTILGAALASAITVVGNYIYSRSLDRTHKAAKSLAQEVVTRVLPSERGTEEVPAENEAKTTDRTVPATAQISTVAEPVEPATAAETSPKTAKIDRHQGEATDPPVSQSSEPESTQTISSDTDLTDPAATELIAPTEPPTKELPAVDPELPPDIKDQGWFSQMLARYGTTRSLIALGLAVFLLIMVAITAIELLLGHTLSDELTGNNTGRRVTFINRPVHQDQPKSPETESPLPHKSNAPTNPTPPPAVTPTTTPSNSSAPPSIPPPQTPSDQPDEPEPDPATNLEPDPGPTDLDPAPEPPASPPVSKTPGF